MVRKGVGSQYEYGYGHYFPLKLPLPTHSKTVLCAVYRAKSNKEHDRHKLVLQKRASEGKTDPQQPQIHCFSMHVSYATGIQKTLEHQTAGAAGRTTVGKSGPAPRNTLDPFLFPAEAPELHPRPEVGPRKVQGELEVGVRLILKASHKANQLANVALLLWVELAPRRHRPEHPALISTATPFL